MKFNFVIPHIPCFGQTKLPATWAKPALPCGHSLACCIGPSLCCHSPQVWECSQFLSLEVLFPFDVLTVWFLGFFQITEIWKYSLEIMLHNSKNDENELSQTEFEFKFCLMVTMAISFIDSMWSSSVIWTK